DLQIVALERIGREVGGDAHGQDDHGKGDPGPFELVENMFEDEVIERPDDQDIEDNEQGDVAKGNDIDIEIIKSLLQRRGDIAAAAGIAPAPPEVLVAIVGPHARGQSIDHAFEKIDPPIPAGKGDLVEGKGQVRDVAAAIGHGGDEGPPVLGLGVD